MEPPAALSRLVWPQGASVTIRLEVNGDKGSLYWDFEEQNYLYYYDRQQSLQEQGFRKIKVTDYAHPYGGDPWPAGHGIAYGDIFVIEIANFVRAITEKKTCHSNFETESNASE